MKMTEDPTDFDRADGSTGTTLIEVLSERIPLTGDRMEHITTMERLHEHRDSIIELKKGTSVNDPRYSEILKLLKQVDTIIQLARL